MRACLLAVVLLACLSLLPTTAYASGQRALSGIRVFGNALVDGDGKPIHLVGVNRSGAEYACIRGWGIFDGPADARSIQAIGSWHANAVRVALNEDCWLGINGVQASYAGTNYQQVIIEYVDELRANGLYAILDLHWSAPGTAPATSLRQMPDADHSVEFWQSVAATFADDPDVLFDVFNEPFGVTWDCWRDGCVFPGGADTGPWQTVGMQSLVDTIRASGARQPILLGGLAFSNDLSEWRSHQPADPLGGLVASFHVYPFNACNQVTCWDDEVASLSASVPVVVSEVGTDWSPPFSDSMAVQLMHWADDNRLGYLAWTWNTWGGSETLITNDSGEPTTWGADFKTHLAQAAVPRLRLLDSANRAYAQHDVHTAVSLYDQAVASPASDEESAAITAAIDGLARFREIVGLTAAGDEEAALHDLALLVDNDPATPLARLAAQFWDQYSMTGSARAACAQLAPQVDTQARAVLETLASQGVPLRHDELCVTP